MKKIFCLLLLVTSLKALSQGKDWFISISTSYLINGPGYILKEKMHDQHFNSYEVGFLWDHDNPIRGWRFNIMGRGGRQITQKTMVYVLAGLADNGWVRGYSESATYSTGAETHPKVDYQLYQFAAGMMYTPGKVMVGIAPALFLLDYKFQEEDKKKSTSLGLNFSLQIPVSKPNKQIGLDLLIDANYASAIEMSRSTDAKNFFQPGKIQMLNGSVGFAFSLRPTKI